VGVNIVDEMYMGPTLVNVAIDLGMGGRVSKGESKCRLVLPHTLQVSLCPGLLSLSLTPLLPPMTS